MTPDWLATETGKRAVEAMQAEDNRIWKLWRSPASHSERLTAALPHLDRLFRERYAKELEAEMKPFVIHGSPEHISRETLRLAAAFLRREPTL